MRVLKEVYVSNRDVIPYNIDFIALAGHICGYATPKEYTDWQCEWNEINLPMIPERWQIKIIDGKEKLYSDIKNKIKTEHYDGFICATDADREGNLIYYLLETKLCLNKNKTYRLWVHDLTESAILKSYKSMVDLHTNNFQKNLTWASILRSRFDWLVGMNATVMATKKAGMLMKIGRVKTPTLKIVYDNSIAIDNFKPKTTYYIVAKYDNGITGILQHEDFETMADAKSFFSNLNSTGIVKNIEVKRMSVQPHQLFKLSDLQVEASKKYGYSPEKTLNLVQSLYETHKAVSYPRCDCRYISSELANDFKKLIQPIKAFKDLAPFVSEIEKNEDWVLKTKSNKRFVNDNEVNKNSHTALLPTTKSISIESLNEEELNILKMIYIRFLCIFFPPFIYDKTIVDVENSGYIFKSNGKKIVSNGFTELLDYDSKDNVLPKIKQGDILNIVDFEAKDKTTTPPKRLTQGDLIKEMENVSKYIDNKDLKEIMKHSGGIGTQATRGSIISSLIKDGYIDTKTVKKSEALYISEKGKTYIDNLLGLDIINPELTAKWESQLQDVEQGKMNSVEFNKNMLRYINDIIIKFNSKKMISATIQKESLGKCPRCGKDVYEGKTSYYCSGYNGSPKCGFSIWKDNKLLKSQKKKLTANKVKKLLSKGYYTEKGLVSKLGKKYDADISFEDTGIYVNLKLNFENLHKNKKST